MLKTKEVNNKQHTNKTKQKKSNCKYYKLREAKMLYMYRDVKKRIVMEVCESPFGVTG